MSFLIVFLFSCKSNNSQVVNENLVTELEKFLKKENSLVLKELASLRMAYDFSEVSSNSFYKDSIDRVESLNSKEIEHIISLHGAKYEVSQKGDNLFRLKDNYFEKLSSELIVGEEVFHNDSSVIYRLSELVTNAGNNFYFLKFKTNDNTSGYFIYFPEINKFVKTDYDNFIDK